eukprot:gene35870-58885_t
MHHPHLPYRSLLALAAAMVCSASAWAQDATEAPSPDALWVNVGALTYHSNQSKGYNENNHGLGVEYKCQICGDHSYWGRRAFDKHFQEWKHAHGMRSLGIPNTKHVHDITLIADAKALYEKI